MATPSAPDDISVKHNEAEHRFEALVEGQLAICNYELEGNQMVFTHTFVPSELRGRGIAEKLVRSALETARREQRKVVPACSYVDVFIKRHAEFQDLLGR
ncbi:MAG: GNAT family N-acetyltransferase [Opitutus sp.]